MNYIGLLLSCSFDGCIQKVILNNVLPELSLQPNTSFISVFQPTTIDKAQSFFLSVIKDGWADCWELILDLDRTYLPIQFSGVKTSKEVLLIGIADADNVVKCYEELMIINSELVNAIRAFHKKNCTDLPQKADNHYMEEMTKLNNELVNMQRELHKNSTELAKTIEEKNLFLGMLAHDLRNPLGAIREFSGCLMDDLEGFLNDKHKDFLLYISTLSNFMLKLVDDVMQITAFDAGKINLHLESHQLSDLLDNTVQINQYLAGKKGSKLILEIHHIQRKFPFDWVKIQQVLLNLISNAIKFSAPGSTIVVSSFDVEGYVVVSVQDPGPGISEADLSKIFSPFTKGSAQVTGSEPSTGLGLAIAQNIITAHKGKLWVESRLGDGSVFSFKLPV